MGVSEEGGKHGTTSGEADDEGDADPFGELPSNFPSSSASQRT